MCSAGWLAENRVSYPMSYSNPKCGFGHVGIVDYGTQTDLSKTWDTFCYRVKGMFYVNKNTAYYTLTSIHNIFNPVFTMLLDCINFNNPLPEIGTQLRPSLAI